MDVYTLPDLPYDVSALEPHYNAKLLELHHGKHHAAYVKQANATLERLAELRATQESDLVLLRSLEKALAFNISGHFLHSTFWTSMSPSGGGRPEEQLGAAVQDTFGSFEAVQRQLNDAIESLQGSGWAALVWEPLGERLVVEQIYDHQANMTPANVPLLVIDGWEHAYYLQFLNEKAKWLEAFWEVVDWRSAEHRFSAATQVSILSEVGS